MFKFKLVLTRAGVRSPGLMRLWCVECDRPSGPEGKGWRLYRVEDPDEEGAEILAAYCRTCARAEFGRSWAGLNEAD